MKPQTQWAVTAGAVVFGFWLLGGCCINTGLHVAGDGKIYVPQVVAGVGLILVPTLIVAGMFVAHLMGFRPADQRTARLQRDRNRREAHRRDLSPPQGGPQPAVPAGWTPVAHLPAALAHLGKHERTFTYTDNRQKGFNLVLCGVAAAAGLAFIALVPVQLSREVPNVGVQIAILLPLGLALLAGGVVGLVTLLRPADLRVLTYEKGLARVDRGRFIVFLWDDLVEIYQTIVDVYQYGLVHTAREYGFALFRCDGQVLTINEGINATDVSPLSDLLQSKVAARRLRRAQQQFQAGQPVPFGPLNISREGLSTDDQKIPWQQVEGVKIDKGVITVRQAGRWSAWSKVPASDIPNLYVFLTLVDQIIGLNRGPR